MEESHVLIRGGRRLVGRICVQGGKNTALPVMAACLLTRGRTILYRCPKIADVYQMETILNQIGCQTEWISSGLVIDSSNPVSSEIPEGAAGRFRGSSLLLGALLARNGSVKLEKPGGCKIGSRPLDYHFMGFQKMGVMVEEKEEGYHCFCERMDGAEISLPYPSVGATENLMLAAAGAKGTTKLIGCAREPEIRDLAGFMIHMGISVEGAGTSCICVTGAKRTCASHYVIPYDRIAAATYLFGAMMTEGDVTLLLGGSTERMENVLCVLESMGARIEREPAKVRLRMEKKTRPVNVKTGPYPAVPTDIQSMILVGALRATGPSEIQETVFDGRFQICKELEKMGAGIKIEHDRAWIEPPERLQGACVEAKDLRGGASLILAGLAAEGETRVSSYSYVERGYEDLVENLCSLGADIRIEGMK